MIRMFVYRSFVIIFLLLSAFAAKVQGISDETGPKNSAIEADSGIVVTLPKEKYEVKARIVRPDSKSLSFFLIRPSGDDCLRNNENTFSFSYEKHCKMYARWTIEHFFLRHEKLEGKSMSSDSNALFSTNSSGSEVTSSFLNEPNWLKSFDACSLDEVAPDEEVDGGYLTSITISREIFHSGCELSLKFGSEYKLPKFTDASAVKLSGLDAEQKSSSGVTLVYILFPILLVVIVLIVLAVIVIVCCISGNHDKQKSQSGELPSYMTTNAEATATTQTISKNVPKIVVGQLPTKPVTKLVSKHPASKVDTTNTMDLPKTTISTAGGLLTEKTAISTSPVSVDEYMDYDEPTRQRLHRQDARDNYIRQLQKYGVQPVGKIRSRGTTEEAISIAMKAPVMASKSEPAEAEMAMRRKGIRDQYEVIPVLISDKTPVKKNKKRKKTSTRNDAEAKTQLTQHSEDATQTVHDMDGSMS